MYTRPGKPLHSELENLCGPLGPLEMTAEGWPNLVLVHNHEYYELIAISCYSIIFNYELNQFNSYSASSAAWDGIGVFFTAQMVD